MTEDERLTAVYWASLVTNKSISGYYKLLEAFGDPSEAFKASKRGPVPQALCEDKILCARFGDPSYVERAESEIKKALNLGINAVSVNDPLYPEALAEYKYKPIMLFYKGDLRRLSEAEITLGIVGSRNCTPSGRDATYRLVDGLKGHGIAVVSGMARGIDSTAHRAALENGLFTAAVLGCGPDVVYPPENKALYSEICERGIVLSEHPPGERPAKQYFPARNRIIAGLSNGILVTEAGLKSGALITVDLALDAGREVMSVPQSVDSVYGSGCNELLKKGAACVTESADILLNLGYSVEQCEEVHADLSKLDKEQLTVYNVVLHSKGLDEDEISTRALTDIVAVKRMLALLEIEGFVRRRDDGIYVAALK